jgi:hypothetical protein
MGSATVGISWFLAQGASFLASGVTLAERAGPERQLFVDYLESYIRIPYPVYGYMARKGIGGSIRLPGLAPQRLRAVWVSAVLARAAEWLERGRRAHPACRDT